MLKRTIVPLIVAIGMVGVGLGAQQRIDSDRAPLTPQDYLDIQQLYASLARGLDSGDANGYAFARNFVADGVQGNLIGQKALAEFAQTWHERRNGANIRHSISNLVIIRTAEGASVSAYLLMLNVGEKPATIYGTAVENDVLVKTSDGWRFKQRAIHADNAAIR